MWSDHGAARSNEERGVAIQPDRSFVCQFFWVDLADLQQGDARADCQEAQNNGNDLHGRGIKPLEQDDGSDERCKSKENVVGLIMGKNTESISAIPHVKEQHQLVPTGVTMAVLKSSRALFR